MDRPAQHNILVLYPTHYRIRDINLGRRARVGIECHPGTFVSIWLLATETMFLHSKQWGAKMGKRPEKGLTLPIYKASGHRRYLQHWINESG